MCGRNTELRDRNSFFSGDSGKSLPSLTFIPLLENGGIQLNDPSILVALTL